MSDIIDRLFAAVEGKDSTKPVKIEVAKYFPNFSDERPFDYLRLADGTEYLPIYNIQQMKPGNKFIVYMENKYRIVYKTQNGGFLPILGTFKREELGNFRAVIPYEILGAYIYWATDRFGTPEIWDIER